MIIGYILQNPQKKISAVKTFFVDEKMVKTRIESRSLSQGKILKNTMKLLDLFIHQMQE